MIHSDDQERIANLLGMENMPEDVEEAVTIVTHFYHAAGGSGPLDGKMLSIVLWMLGHKPKSLRTPPPTKVDWRQVPRDGSVRVEALDKSQWMPGVFMGPMDFGVAVRLDGDVAVKEFSSLQVRLAAEKFSDAGKKKDTKRGAVTSSA